MKKIGIVVMMVLGMHLVSFAQEMPMMSGMPQQVDIVGEFVPVEIESVPLGVLNAVDNAYSESKIEAIAKEVNEDGEAVYQFTLLKEDGILYNVYFTDRGIELK